MTLFCFIRTHGINILNYCKNLLTYETQTFAIVFNENVLLFLALLKLFYLAVNFALMVCMSKYN